MNRLKNVKSGDNSGREGSKQMKCRRDFCCDVRSEDTDGVVKVDMCQ